MLDAKARQLFDGVSKAAGSAVGRSGISPNVLTVAGVGVSAAAAWQIVAGRHLAAALVIVAAGGFDVLDGSVARQTGKTSKLGGFLDSVTDRVSDALLFGALAWMLLAQGRSVASALALVSLVCALLISYVRARAEALDFSCNTGLFERAERLIILIIGLAVGAFIAEVLLVALWILAIGTVFTFLQRVVHVSRQARTAA